jgi:predicted metal-binding membrane protein
MKLEEQIEISDTSLAFHWTNILWPWTLFVAAWIVILLAFSTNQAYLVDHDYLLKASHLPWILSLLIFLALWQIMIVAMMLPSTFPLLSLIASIAREQKHLWLRQTAFIAGYAIIWSAFALIAFLGDTLIHWSVNHWFWFYLHSWLISAALFALAGAYQFSPLKTTYCAFPAICPNYYQQGMRANWHSGLRYGLYCLASCWALMLVMFGVGVRGLLWMVALTVVVLVEKGVPGGYRLRPMIGAGFLLLAIVWIVAPTWL